MRGYKIFAGTASVDFAKEVCLALDVPVAKAEIKRLVMERYQFKSLRVFVVVMFLSFNQLVFHQMIILWNFSS